MGTKKHDRQVIVPDNERKPILSAEEKEELTRYTFPFENIVFEGGGSKGSASIGAIRVLEEVGLWSKIKRYAGASSGALLAIWTSLGYDSYEIEKLMDITDAKVYDARFGKLSLIPNIWKSYGWHPGKKLLKCLGSAVKEKLGDPDATFADLYFKTGMELAIIVTNVNHLDCVYCHVKTTPHMPIRLAVRMSCSIPGVLAPVKYALHHGTPELFCDGGLTCNYPIHVYDGWYLSLKPKDTFLKKIPDLQDTVATWDHDTKFGTAPNEKTIGLLLYSDNEQEMFKVQLDERIEKFTTTRNPWPKTKKAKAKYKADNEKDKVNEKCDQIMDVMCDFLEHLGANDLDDSSTISRKEFVTTLEKVK